MSWHKDVGVGVRDIRDLRLDLTPNHNWFPGP